ncbi:hypothetical protein M9Y10_022487 [Tritrichomonas musculus]|uniref:PDEase domain-containing protein n=1 Tax=Tritrichomonas musculus TaxID=1915356 RepID=A0ABR2KSG4_9EUKA
MSVQLKAAMRSFTRNGNKSSFQRIVNFGKASDAPFEHFHNFVVAPTSPPISPSNNTRRKIAQPKLAPLEEPPVIEVQDQPEVQGSFPQKDLLAYDHRLEKFLKDVTETSLYEAAEKLFTKQFDASEAAFWIDIPSIGVLYSPSQSIYAEYNKGIAGSVYKSRSIFTTTRPTEYPNFDESVDGNMIPANCPTISFPVFNEKNRPIGVVLCVRPQGCPEFGDEEEQFIMFFQHKFQLLSRWLLDRPVQQPMILDLLQLHRMTELLPALTLRMQFFFNCRKCEIWSMDRQKKKLILYEEKQTKEMQIQDSGIIGYVIENEVIVNTFSVKRHHAYNQAIDGDTDEALIAIPVVESTNRYMCVAVLRGPIGRPIFTSEDEESFKNLSPFIALSLSNALAFTRIQTEFEKSSQEREGLAALLEVAEILSGQLDTERLCEIIMEKGRYLTKADRCSLFLVSQTRDHLITSFHRGLKNCINIPITKGIVGRTVTEAKVLNIPDAYEDPNFDNTTDVQTGYRTRSILSVPIFNQRGEVMGVTEMINKTGDQPFSKWDTNLIQIFNVFCGISLENARLYKESLDMSSQLRSFFGISVSFAKTEDAKHLTSDILRNARRALDSRRATIFLADESSDQFTSFIVDGGKIPGSLPINEGIIGECFRSKEGIICNDAYGDSRFNREVDKITGFKTVSLCAVPLVSPGGSILGVIEIVNRIHGGFREKDLKLLNSIATFISVAIEKSRLKSIAKHGDVEVELPKYVNESERKETTIIPAKLALKDEEINRSLSIDFYAPDWEGGNLTKLIFYLFNYFGFLEGFNISNETFFHFIYEIKRNYKQVAYHNWAHACDVTQFLSYEIKTSNADKIFTQIELFTLLTTALCHDVNHYGYDNNNSLNSEIPLGMLFKEKAFKETHHCFVAISILTRNESNIMASLSPSDAKFMWNLLIKLIYSTDMALHFRMIQNANDVCDKKLFFFDNDENRIMAMELLLKAADISNVSRPFSIADKWCEMMMNEVGKLGDNDLSLEKPRSQIGFYNFICIPLYQTVAKIFPDLEVNLNSVKSNLEVWKAMMSPNSQ